MPTIAVASQNPVKANSIRSAFQRLFPEQVFEVVTAHVASGVADQPMSDEETWQGASNRLDQVREQLPACDYWSAIEGGIQETSAGMIALAWILVASPTAYGEAKTATFPLPPKMADLVRQGVELGHACDQLYAKHNTKQSEGAIGLLSNNQIDRQAYYEHAAVMALLPLRHEADYRG